MGDDYRYIKRDNSSFSTNGSDRYLTQSQSPVPNGAD